MDDITVPSGGVYTNVPGTLAVAFNCVALSAVPATTAAGVFHVMEGVALVTVIVLEPVAPV
jgi:hypothetical protein